MKNENDIFGSERGFGADTGISAVTIYSTASRSFAFWILGVLSDF